MRAAFAFLMDMQANGIRQAHELEVEKLRAQFEETTRQREEFAAKAAGLKIAPAPPPVVEQPAPTPSAPAAPPAELVALIRQIANEVALSAIRDHGQQAVPVQTQPLPMPTMPMPVAAPFPAWPAPAWPAYNPHSRRW